MCAIFLLFRKRENTARKKERKKKKSNYVPISIQFIIGEMDISNETQMEGTDWKNKLELMESIKYIYVKRNKDLFKTYANLIYFKFFFFEILILNFINK